MVNSFTNIFAIFLVFCQFNIEPNLSAFPSARHYLYSLDLHLNNKRTSSFLIYLICLIVQRLHVLEIISQSSFSFFLTFFSFFFFFFVIYPFLFSLVFFFFWFFAFYLYENKPTCNSFVDKNIAVSASKIYRTKKKSYNRPISRSYLFYSALFLATTAAVTKMAKSMRTNFFHIFFHLFFTLFSYNFFFFFAFLF